MGVREVLVKETKEEKTTRGTVFLSFYTDVYGSLHEWDFISYQVNSLLSHVLCLR